MSNLLEVDSIRKEFGTKRVLTDIAFHCKPGEIIGLLGRNGSGKSTLLNIIFGTQSAEHIPDGKTEFTYIQKYKLPFYVGGDFPDKRFITPQWIKIVDISLQNLKRLTE